MIGVTDLIIFYIISFIISYLIRRHILIKTKEEPDWGDVIIVLTPIVNTIIITIHLLYHLQILLKLILCSKKLPHIFYIIKKNKNEKNK